MDISMPVMDGYEASKGIRQLEQKYGVEKSRIIALSAHNSETIQNEAYACLMDSYGIIQSLIWFRV